MEANEFSDRLWNFAADVGRFIETLPDTRVGRHVAGQLVRCGTSSAPNYDEACVAESRLGFVHKVSIAPKEMRESRGWIKFCLKSGLVSAKEIHPLLEEANQLFRMLAKSASTARKKGNDSAELNS